MAEWVSTCSEVEHVKIWREIVSDVPSGQMVQVGLMKELPTIPDNTREESHDLSISIQNYSEVSAFLQIKDKNKYKNTKNESDISNTWLYVFFFLSEHYKGIVLIYLK